MSRAKAVVQERLQDLPDEITDELELVERLYSLVRFEHSKSRCETEGVYSDSDVAEHFRKKREMVLS